MKDIVDRLRDPEAYIDAVDGAIATIEDLRRELRVTEGILNDRTRVLEAIPECRSHGRTCIPHAIQWIEEAKKSLLVVAVKNHNQEAEVAVRVWNAIKMDEVFAKEEQTSGDFTLNSIGYPTLETLRAISAWTRDRGYVKLMEHIREIWKYADGYWGQDKNGYRLSTAGWSGNEDIIIALSDNVMFWSTCWRSSERGGHHIFVIPEQFRMPG